MTDSDPIILQLDQFWPYQTVLLADLISRYTLSILKAHNGNLNLSQWRVLAAIAEKPGRTSAEIVAITPMDKGIVSRAVKNLLVMKLIEKAPIDTDRRRSPLHMTPEGITHYTCISKNLAPALQTLKSQHADPEQLSQILSDYIQEIRAIA